MKTYQKTSDDQVDQQDKKISDTQDPNKQPNPDPTKTPDKPWKDPDPTIPEEGNKIYADRDEKRDEEEEDDTDTQSKPVKDSKTDKTALTDINNAGNPHLNESTEENRKQDPSRTAETKGKETQETRK